MIEKTVTYSVIEKEDLERVASKILGKETKISEMDVELYDLVPSNYAEGNVFTRSCGITFNIFVNYKQVNPMGVDYFSLPKIDQAILHEKYIFNFDVKEFKSYKRTINTDRVITNEKLKEIEQEKILFQKRDITNMHIKNFDSISPKMQDFILAFVDEFSNEIGITKEGKIFAIYENSYPKMATFCQKNKNLNDYNEIKQLKLIFEYELFCVMLLYDADNLLENELAINEKIKNIEFFDKIFIPAFVRYNFSYLFFDTSNIISICVDPKNKYYNSRENCNALLNYGRLILGCCNTKIPSDINYIGVGAFYKCKNLKKILLPSKLKTICFRAFEDCVNLESIEIPENVDHIGDFTFARCKNMKFIKLPKNIDTINFGTFYECSKLESINLPENIIEIKESAFENCSSLTSIRIPKSTKFIGYKAFKGCSNLTSIILSSMVKLIKREAFADCISLEFISVDSNNKYYDSRENCNAIIQTKGDVLIQGCYKTIITKDVKVIGYKAFINCDKLRTIIIPKSISLIDSLAFSNCENLMQILYEGNIEDFNKIKIKKSSGINKKNVYFYSIEKPKNIGNYWHYVNGIPKIWNIY